MDYLFGQIFGRYLSFGKGIKKDGKTLIMCVCECGNLRYVSKNSLLRGSSTSCGCYRAEIRPTYRRSHGLTSHQIYSVWTNMKTRCYNSKTSNYHRYGGRGISVCSEWKYNASIFIKWCLENGWKPGLQIDRINNSGNYEPSNCRIVTSKQNSNNRDLNINVLYNGDYYSLAALSEKSGLTYTALYQRLFVYKWDIERALTPPKIKPII